jgi:prevent-host-death family protein
MHEAKTHLSRLVEQAAKGETIIIAKSGKPVAKLVPLEPATGRRRLGSLDGQFSIPDDFNTMFAKEIEEMFYGEE